MMDKKQNLVVKTPQIIMNKNSPNHSEPIHDVSQDVNASCGTSTTCTIKKYRRTHKRTFCVFCEQLVTHFSRHLDQHHSNEEDVQDIFKVLDENLNERKRKRNLIISKIRNRGNFIYNNLQPIDGELLIKKKPSNNSYRPTALTHATCKYCYATVLRENLYLHVKKCPNRNLITEIEPENAGKRSRILKTASIVMFKMSDNDSKFEKEILGKMCNDMISLIARTDPLILKFGHHTFRNHRESQHRKYVSSKMRDLARLFLTMEENDDNITKLEDCLQPCNFERLMQSIQKLGQYDEETGEVGIVSIGQRFCSTLKTCADIIVSESIKCKETSEAEKSSTRARMDRLHHLLKFEWRFEIGTNSEKSRKKSHAKKTDVRPFDEDIILVSNGLDKMYDPSICTLEKCPNLSVFENLNKTIIMDIILLCRRRPGEVVRATLDHYYKINAHENQSLIHEDVLTSEEKNAAKYLSIFYVPGKNTQKVPILLTPNMRKGIECLINARTSLELPKEPHDYLFLKPHSTEPYDGSEIIAEFAQKFSLKNPKHFTATGLRHHLATDSQLHERNDAYTESLATFMGHSLEIDKSNNRLPVSLIQKAQVGLRLLELTNKQNNFHEENTKNDTMSQNESSSLDSENQEEPKFKKGKRCRWQESDKEIIHKYFGTLIKDKINPSRGDIRKMYSKEKSLQNRPLTNVYTYINNFVTGKVKFNIH